MAKRYSGRVVVTVLYDDHDYYKASVAVPGRSVWQGRIYPPKSGYGAGVAYDSPKAYDRTARAAISFAREVDNIDHELAFGDHDVHLGRSSATRRPTVSNPSKKRKGARKAPKRTAAQRSASARKGARTRARNAKKRSR